MSSSRDRDRTDDVQRKLGLLAAAYAAGRRDVAMSLAESIKDTLEYERMAEAGPGGTLHSGPDEFTRVDDLPAAWAGWARGWSFVKSIALFETVGLERAREPVTIRLGIRADQATDPRRELRVARVEADSSLREVPSQVNGVLRDNRGWRCRLLIPADVPGHGRATYLVFFGNRFAERPDYVTDLRVQGEGYGLEVTNHHYVARLSHQMGQLERLISRREHGLELYAGGKGHGEPPCIDWAHDYVDRGGFQKLRMRNWAACPNFEVESGPMAVRVRRWGFPHSPVHPVFTPSRIHMDQTYTFYAGLPYFLKEGRMDVLQDVDVEAMRDDEWVFSGYSFTESLWIDRAGKLREGPVPASDAENLWGVGFRHRDSKDAFLALWLEHTAEGFDAIGHNGSPTLHYPGHGQLWSRYPAQRTKLKAGTSLRQKNAYQIFAYPEQDAGRQIEELRHRLLHPVEVTSAEVPRGEQARVTGALARPGEAGDIAPLKTGIWNVLRAVRDEQLYAADANIVDLGLVYDVRLRHGTVSVLMTMPHRGRPVHDFFVTRGGGRVDDGIQERLMKLDFVRDVVVDLTWDPPWTPARLTDAGRRALELDGA
jgi:metal-sulfur cluster biosynthetic enzyme